MRENRKAAQKQLTELEKGTEALHRQVASAKAATLNAKKTKAPAEEAMALELNERAALMEHLSKIMILAGALGNTKTATKALSAFNSELRMYNATVRTLPKAQRKMVGELERSLGEQIQQTRTLPKISRVRVEKPVVEEEITILPSYTAQADPVAEAMTLTAELPSNEEIVLAPVAARTAPKKAVQKPSETPVAAPKAASAPEAPVAVASAPKAPDQAARRDQALLEEFNAYNEQKFAREAEKSVRENRKSAQKQLSALEAGTSTQVRKIAEAKSAVQNARRAKAPTTALLATELNARAALITDLAKIMLLGGALGQNRSVSKATSQMNAEVRAYNATLSLLPKKARKEVAELSKTLSSELLQRGALPTIPALRVPEISTEDDFVMLPSATASTDPVAVAMAAAAAQTASPELMLAAEPVKRAQKAKTTEKSAPKTSTPEASAVSAPQPEKAADPKVAERARAEAALLEEYNAYNEQAFAREAEKTARTDRKSAQKQLSELDAQNLELRRKVALAKVESLNAKRKATASVAPVADELNAHAALIENLCRSLILAGALSEKRSVRKINSELTSEIRAYNTVLRSLPKKQRKSLGELSTALISKASESGTLPTITRVRVEGAEEEIVILPSPSATSDMRGAMRSASAPITPEELIFSVPESPKASVAAREKLRLDKAEIRRIEKNNESIRTRIATAETAALTATKQKSSSTSARAAELNARASLIESYARIITLAKSSALTNKKSEAMRKMSAEIRVYNAKAKAFSKAERTAIPTLAEKLAQSVAGGVPMQAIARIRLDSLRLPVEDLAAINGVTGKSEEIIVVPAGELTMPIKRGITETTVLTGERAGRIISTSTEEFDKKQMRTYLKRQQKQIDTLSAERKKEEAILDKAKDAAKVACVLRVRNTTARIMAVEIDCMEILRDAPAFRGELASFKTALSVELRRYNKTTDTYKKLTGTKLSCVSKNLPELILQGEPYEAPKLAEFFEGSESIPAIALVPTVTDGLERESVYENLSDPRTAAVGRAKRRARTEDYAREEAVRLQTMEIADAVTLGALANASASRDYSDIEEFERYQYREFLKSTTKEIRGYEGQISDYRKQLAKAQENDTRAAILGAIVKLRRSICDVYIRIMKTGVAVGAVREAKRYAKLAKTEIITYNRELKDLGRYTGLKYPQADTRIPALVLKKKAYKPMPTVTCELDPSEALKAEQELHARQARNDDRQKRIDSALAKKHKKKQQKKTKKAKKEAEENAFKPLTKQQIKAQNELDLAVISARYEEEIRVLMREIYELELRYTMHPKKTKEEVNKRKAYMREIMNEMKKALRYEKRDNKRYFALVSMKSKKLSTKRMDEASVSDYQKDLLELMEERRKLNERLLSLYRGVDGGSNTQITRAERIHTTTFKKQIRKQRRLTVRIRRLHVTIPQKEQLFKLINKRASLESQLAMEKKKIKLFKLSGKAKKAQKIEIAKIRAELARLNKQFDRKMRARVATDSRYVSPESMVTWFFVLIGLIGVFAVLYIFRQPLFEMAKVLIQMLFDK